MILVGVGCLIAVLQSPASDSLRLLAVSLPQTSLVLQVRERPLAVRDAVTESLRRGELDAAGENATPHPGAGGGSFPLRRGGRVSGRAAGGRGGPGGGGDGGPGGAPRVGGARP